MKCHVRITKSQAIDLFGSRKALCEALDVQSQALSRHDELLSIGMSQRVIGAAWLLNMVRKIKRITKM
jgi:hypothetical protein